MSTAARISLLEYDRMIERGVFDERKRRRLELIRGELRQMNPIGSRHEVLVDYLNEWSIRELPAGQVWVRVQNSIGLPELESAPEPDIAWVERRDFSAGRPEGDDVLLVIEVAETSLRYDRTEKAALYAAAGIAEYWVVDAIGQTVEVLRSPADGQYRDRHVHSGEDHVRPLAFPDVFLVVSRLFTGR